jgi:GT2 family glycosyltransferase
LNAVYANICTRDGLVSDEVLVRVQAAVRAANRAGVPAVMARSKDPYSVAACRNRGVATFRADPRFTHFLSIDDDVMLPEDAVGQLCRTAERTGAAVVLGGYPTVRVPLSGDPFLYVTLMPLGKSGDAGWLRTWPTADVECEGGGTGCMLVRRDVFEALGFPWFRWTELYDEERAIVRAATDDMDFCARARLAGFRVWAAPVRCGHRKAVDLSMFVGTLPGA